MREIVFRGKAIELDEWVYGFYYAKDDSRKGKMRHVIVWQNNGAGWAYIDDPIYPETIGQYTGVKDSKGTKIFEGDILKDKENFLWVVDWQRGGFYIYNVHVVTAEPLLSDIYEDIEEEFVVVGNIHDNANLLEVQ